MSSRSVEASQDQLISNARQLAPSLRARAAAMSAARTVTNDVMDDIGAAGLRCVLKPRQFGGAGQDMDTVLRVGRALSEGDGSTAWVYVVMSLSDMLVNAMPEKVQQDYWTSAQPTGASTAIPAGPNTGATPADGGFVLNGKWSYCSGIDHSGWVMIGTSVGMLENPPRPDLRFMLVPVGDVTIIDDWNVMGMAGTGSKTVALEQVFVPHERIIPWSQIGSGFPDHANPHYRGSLWAMSSFCIAAAATGIARAMYDMTVEAFSARKGKPDPLFDLRKPILQSELAEASALIDCSDLLYNRALDESFAQLRAGIPLSIEQRVRNRRDQVFSARLARQAGEILLAANGSRAVADASPLQRCFRDLSTITTHPGAHWSGASLSFGSVAIGGPPLEFMI